MSDAARQNLKISREGIVLIKSFEGFRPRAIQRQEGGWVIGYGHTLSAREGATVSEADAELLLRYDLLPVEKSLNETIPASLNQHQFDALASFAFSVGLDRFADSDVRQRLTAGAPAEAAEAMMGWPEPLVSDTALRRRVAERALFSADPATPVALADLLAAPLPPPPVVPEPVEVAAPEADVAPAELEADVQTEAGAVDPRGAAVATLLGEVADTPETAATADAEPAPVESEPVAFVVPILEPQTPVVDAEPVEAEPAESAVADLEPQPTPDPTTEEAAEHTETLAEDAPVDADAEVVATPFATESAPEASDDAPIDPNQRAMAMARFSPYGAGMMGPLPYLRPASPRLVQPTPEVETESEIEPERETAPAIKAEAAPEPSTPVFGETLVAETEDTRVANEIEETPVVVEADETFVAEAEIAQTHVAPMSYVEPASASDDAPVLHIASAPLVLTPMEDAPEPAVARALWTPEQRAEPATAEGGLFGEDLSLTQSVGPVLGQEFDPEPPVRFDWSETGAFIIMGAVGLTAFGASMAAFRLASEQANGGSETTMIAWVLAVIGAACVGVSSFNLYRRWGLPGGD